MKIGVIQASSQTGKNEMIHDAVKLYAKGHEIVNFGCFEDEDERYSYIEVSLMIGLLLNSKAVDLIVTGCSSGQGMMLSCNSIPGVLCGYIPTPQDAYLFAQINNGNCVSLPLGEEYTWHGKDNMYETLKDLFKETFGQGYPRSEAARKLKDTLLLKEIRRRSQIGFIDFLDRLDEDLIKRILLKHNVIDYAKEYSKDQDVTKWIMDHTS